MTFCVVFVCFVICVRLMMSARSLLDISVTFSECSSVLHPNLLSPNPVIPRAS